MTTSRAIRGTRAKVFFYICALLIITGLIACYNNTLSQLDDVRKSNDICHQQEENLSTQLQVISDYKQRLEKSLKTEKAEHQQNKINLENKLNEERSKNDKTFGDAKLKFDSLQQHFNLLQTEYDDFKEECSKNQQKQQEEVNDLQSKLEEVKEELNKVKSSKEGLKNEYMELISQKGRIEKQLEDFLSSRTYNESQIKHLLKKNYELQRELEKGKGGYGSQDTLQQPHDFAEPSSPSSSNKISSVSPSSSGNLDAKLPQAANPNQNVLAKPSDNNKMPSSKSTTKSGVKPSTGSLNGARPLLIPTVTPETLQNKKVIVGVQDTLNQPERVLAIPQKFDDQKEQSNVMNNRYRNVKDSANEEKPVNPDIDTGAREEMDAPQNGFDELQFGGDEHVKNSVKQNGEKKHIDHLAVNKERKNYDQDQYKDLQNDVQLEENEEDDDAEGYDDHLARQKDLVVRD